VSRDVLLPFFSWIIFLQALENNYRVISNFSDNRYSQVKVHHQYQRHRQQICHRCQRQLIEAGGGWWVFSSHSPSLHLKHYPILPAHSSSWTFISGHPFSFWFLHCQLFSSLNPLITLTSPVSCPVPLSPFLTFYSFPHLTPVPCFVPSFTLFSFIIFVFLSLIYIVSFYNYLFYFFISFVTSLILFHAFLSGVSFQFLFFCPPFFNPFLFLLFPPFFYSDWCSFSFVPSLFYWFIPFSCCLSL
jgi:hypothetical protein